MATKDNKYFHQRLLALRNAIDETLKELEATIPEETPAPRSRRNLKEERIAQFELNYTMGKWSKPKSLKKKRA